MAADPIGVSTSSSPIAVPVHDQNGFDWGGFYAGIFGGVRNGSVSGSQPTFGIQAGVNAQFDFYLVGAEVAVEGLTGGVGETSYGQLLGRAGLVATDDVVIYAAGGYGIDLGAPAEEDVLLGVGAEMAISDSLSIEAQYLRSVPVGGANASDQFTIGTNFHF
ncbi:outer membrane protein [Devosia albogilva]|uniref:Outer membrane protein n=1 Tax=Devosia albogilva TaxID=429726 RepID=A0ABW5QFN6_9HYPH